MVWNLHGTSWGGSARTVDVSSASAGHRGRGGLLPSIPFGDSLQGFPLVAVMRPALSHTIDDAIDIQQIQHNTALSQPYLPIIKGYIE